MKRLLTFIKESLNIFEGGHSIEGAEPIRGDLAKEVADQIISKIKDKFHIECAALGSTGKKGKDQTSGDIDIAVQMQWEDKDELIDFVKKEFKDCPFGNIVDYLNVFNIGYKYKEDGKEKIVQVDFMFVDDVEWAQFVYFSPNFLKNESQFKGSWRSTLLRGICACTPTEKVNKKYKTEYFDSGKTIKTFWKFTFSQASGLFADHKTYEGNNGKVLKNPKTIKDDRIYISKNIDEILHICLGNDATRDDCNSYETLLNFLASDRYEFKSVEQLEQIKEWLFGNTDLLREASDGVKKNAEELFNKTIKYVKQNL